ncbi:flagellar basal-body rod protein FlgG [Pedomonas mirosovicensis]|uniref:flagellar basal-body rod protein FlgG n=1 Tax=Pedomonas mirosovicensis TaxID=2908641 RepID=UPI0021680611|nr:flagellar basal-body rod protein FlgG [Pedomonas mirosovicensis]MCH8685102.1 flagellar basal-body rod protein FlgG [Pedomonas mirosovicensis]
MRALNIAATGMLAQQMNVEVISNNIANMNTTAFKRHRAEFQDLLYQNVRRVGSQTSEADTRVASGIQIGVGVRAGGVYRIAEQGDLTQTGNPYDIAIDGRGYFRVELPSGVEAYTRAGSFQLSDQGELVTPDGYRVLPGILVPPDAVDVTIAANGTVQVKQAGQVDYQTVGQIDLATFPNEAGLENIGDNLLLESPASGVPTIGVPTEEGVGKLRQGLLETSNVNPVSEITALITAQRAYEMNSKVIQTADEMMNATNQIR